MQNQHTVVLEKFIEKTLDAAESPNPRRPMSKSFLQHNLFFSDYQPLSVIGSWMKLLQSMFSTFVEIETIGTSYEGRPIRALRVGKPNPDVQKPVIVVTGASHAREWISVSTVCYMAYSLITGYGRNSKGVDSMVEDYDWVFIPTLNVDG